MAPTDVHIWLGKFETRARFTTLPLSLLALPNLKKIKADKNLIALLPDAFACDALTSLILGNNELESLPASIGNLPKP